MGSQRRFHRKLSVVFLGEKIAWCFQQTLEKLTAWFYTFIWTPKTLPDTCHRMQRMHLIWKEEAGMRRLLQVHRAPVQPVPRCQGQLPKLSHASSIYATWWPVVAFYLKKKKVPLHVFTLWTEFVSSAPLNIVPAGVWCGAVGFFASYLTAAIKKLSVLMSLVVTEQQFHCYTLSHCQKEKADFFFQSASQQAHVTTSAHQWRLEALC